MGKFYGSGETFQVRNETAFAIDSGSPLVIDHIHGVALGKSQPGELMNIRPEGIFEFPVITMGPVALGAAIYITPGTGILSDVGGEGQIAFGHLLDPIADMGTTVVRVRMGVQSMAAASPEVPAGGSDSLSFTYVNDPALTGYTAVLHRAFTGLPWLNGYVTDLVEENGLQTVTLQIGGIVDILVHMPDRGGPGVRPPGFRIGSSYDGQGKFGFHGENYILGGNMNHNSYPNPFGILVGPAAYGGINRFETVRVLIVQDGDGNG